MTDGSQARTNNHFRAGITHVGGSVYVLYMCIHITGIHYTDMCRHVCMLVYTCVDVCMYVYRRSSSSSMSEVLIGSVGGCWMLAELGNNPLVKHCNINQHQSLNRGPLAPTLRYCFHLHSAR